MKTTALSLRHLAVIVAFLATLLINFLSQGAAAFNLTLFPRTVAELGERYPIYFLPSGYVFAIWGVIYIGIGAFVVYHSTIGRFNPCMAQVGWLFVLSSLANMVWLVLFLDEQFALSTLAMLVLLGSLLRIYLVQEIGRQPVSAQVRWAAHIPFSIYLGWITVATVANIAYTLFDSGWAGFGISGELWAAIMVAVAALITVLMVVRRRDVAYALVVIWALIGIVVRYPEVATVALAAGLAAAGIGVVVALQILGGRRVAAA
ncbi:MAG: tryptophan-rich sensory protein [Chloroflexi bacterium CFX4]|nr:tryptophan-rich sensory protein [Chloroflexi bacterium CFX4]MDL1921459.1 tryptophan-rich sensory protein [Chloroflexi bacterium CFX3]